MGFLLKALSFALGLMLVGLGAWFVAIPLFLYSLWGIAFHRKRSKSKPEKGDEEEKGAFPLGLGKGIGWILLFLATLALIQGGRFSVLLFGGGGIVVLLWNRIPFTNPLQFLVQVKESTLLRSVLAPVVWVSVSEVKLLNRNAATTLSAADGSALMVVSDGPSIYVVTRVWALSFAEATAKATRTLSEMASAMLPSGGLLIPLDSLDGASVLGLLSHQVGPGSSGWKQQVTSGAFDCIWLVPKGGHVVSMGFYRGAKEARLKPRLAGRLRRLRRPPLLWEVIKTIETRTPWKDPDDLTGYVAALGARRGRPLSERVPEGRLEGEVVVSEVFGGRSISLKATQLRVLLDLYR